MNNQKWTIHDYGREHSLSGYTSRYTIRDEDGAAVCLVLGRDDDEQLATRIASDAAAQPAPALPIVNERGIAEQEYSCTAI